MSAAVQNPQMCGMTRADEEDGIGWRRRTRRRSGGGVCLEGGGGRAAVYYCLKGSGCCVQINKREIIAEGLYIYFLS